MPVLSDSRHVGAGYGSKPANMLAKRYIILRPRLSKVLITRKPLNLRDHIGFQATAEENVSTHHYANVLFNILRGGIVNDQYKVSSRDFAATIANFNHGVYQRSERLLNGLPEKIDFTELLSTVREQGDPQLERLCC